MVFAGVEVGEIGPRMALKYADNGYLGLKDVRIPRENMLMKNSQVFTSSQETYFLQTFF